MAYIAYEYEKNTSSNIEALEDQALRETMTYNAKQVDVHDEDSAAESEHGQGSDEDGV